VASKHFITKSPDAVDRFVQALIEAEEYVQTNEQELYDIILSHEKITEDYLNFAEAKQKYIIELPQRIVVSLEDFSRWAIDNNVTHRTSIPNYLEYIYIDALEKTKPEAITIIR
jgi:NitT/TauT family transport system substrate-binding protein